MSVAFPSFFALPAVVGLTASKLVATNSSNALVSVAFPASSGSALISSDAGVLSWGKPWEGYLAAVSCSSPLSGAGTPGSPLVVDLSSKLGVNAQAADSAKLENHAASYFQVAGSYQAAHAALSSIAALSWSSGSPLVKMTAAGTFGLDTSVYLTTVTAHKLLSATHDDTVADTVVRGDVLIGNATPKWSRLAFPGTPTGKVLQATATDVAWSSNSLTLTTALTNQGGAGVLKWPAAGATLAIPVAGTNQALVAAEAATVAGYIPFYSTTTGILTSDAGLFWNNSLKRLGIGTTEPGAALHFITSESGNVAFFQSSIGITILHGCNMNLRSYGTRDSFINFTDDGWMDQWAIGSRDKELNLKFSIGADLTNPVFEMSRGGYFGIGVAPTSPIHYVKADSSAMTDFLMNPTVKSSGNFIDWQIGGVSKALIDFSGMGFLAGLTLTDAKNVVLGTTTGTKIGTATSQKLGFFNATPIVQPTGIAAQKINYAAGDLDSEAEIITAINTLNGAINGLRTIINTLGLASIV